MSKKQINVIEYEEGSYFMFDYDEDEELLEFDIVKEGDANVKLNKSRST